MAGCFYELSVFLESLKFFFKVSSFWCNNLKSAHDILEHLWFLANWSQLTFLCRLQPAVPYTQICFFNCVVIGIFFDEISDFS